MLRGCVHLLCLKHVEENKWMEHILSFHLRAKMIIHFEISCKNIVKPIKLPCSVIIILKDKVS